MLDAISSYDANFFDNATDLQESLNKDSKVFGDSCILSFQSRSFMPHMCYQDITCLHVEAFHL